MSNESGDSRIGFSGALFLVFLALKLGEVGAVATWSWWCVTAPLWAPLVLIIPLAGIVLAVKAIGAAQDEARHRALRSGWVDVGQGVSYRTVPLRGIPAKPAIPAMASPKAAKPNRWRQEHTSGSGRKYGAMGSNFDWNKKGK